MMVVLVSSCIGVDEELKVANFTYKGSFDGEEIKSVVAGFDPGKFSPNKGREYIVHLDAEKVLDGVLYGKMRRYRDLDEVLDSWSKK